MGTKRIVFTVPHVEAKMNFMFIKIKNSLRNFKKETNKKHT